VGGYNPEFGPWGRINALLQSFRPKSAKKQCVIFGKPTVEYSSGAYKP